MSVGHEGLRVRAAKLAAAAAALKQASGAAAPFSLTFLTDRRRIADPEPVLRALPARAAVIYRDYDDPKRAAVAALYASICRARGVLFLVAGDLALAHKVGADGLHLPARLLSETRLSLGRGQRAPFARAGEGTVLSLRARTPHPKIRRRIFGLSQGRGEDRNASQVPASLWGEMKGRPLLITAACHDAEELRRARDIGAGLALLSPVFPTKSHPGTEHLGTARFKALAAASPIPVLALGGVDATNARELAGPNVAGFAAIGAFGSP